MVKKTPIERKITSVLAKAYWLLKNQEKLLILDRALKNLREKSTRTFQSLSENEWIALDNIEYVLGELSAADEHLTEVKSLLKFNIDEIRKL